ncbi:MAG: dinitrogenase iron-molybdenum cofactor biosynthesis protein [Thermoprotei archaeon]|nr:MAG: dinitrogenase iron-molybdenum cofactor biosynthesis protein [Thermoprotei archaeon]
MRIAIPVGDERQGLESEIFEHFGHAPYFLLIDVENGEIVSVKTLKNPYAEEHMPGQIPQLLSKNNVELLICRGVGRRAMEMFRQIGIEVIRGAQGKASQVIEACLKGELVSKEYKPSRKWESNRYSNL